MELKQFQTFALNSSILFLKNHLIFNTLLLASKNITHSYIHSDIGLHCVDRVSNIQSAWYGSALAT